jgi:hypothetical protein
VDNDEQFNNEKGINVMRRQFFSVVIISLVACGFCMALVASTSVDTQTKVKINATDGALIVNDRQLVVPVIKVEKGQRVAHWNIPGVGDDTRILKPGENPDPRWVKKGGEILGAPTPPGYSSLESANKLINWYLKGGRGEYKYDGNDKLIGAPNKNQPPVPKYAQTSPKPSGGGNGTPYGDGPVTKVPTVKSSK